MLAAILWCDAADPQLVTVNNPDKIIFVGEALVGNEAVDQLTKFDRALKDFSGAGTGGGQRKRGIDGIILTKFDTIVSLF
jgi:signal recognition particle receptor subunit alpha